MAEQADQWEHRIKEGLSKVQPAFTAHHQKRVIFRLLIKKDLHRLTACPHCPASKGVTTQLRPGTPQLSQGNAASSIRPAWDSMPSFDTAASCPALHHATHDTVSVGYTQQGRATCC